MWRMYHENVVDANSKYIQGLRIWSTWSEQCTMKAVLAQIWSTSKRDGFGVHDVTYVPWKRCQCKFGLHPWVTDSRCTKKPVYPENELKNKTRYITWRKDSYSRYMRVVIIVETVLDAKIRYTDMERGSGFFCIHPLYRSPVLVSSLVPFVCGNFE